jgi:hypothetical protein
MPVAPTSKFIKVSVGIVNVALPIPDTEMVVAKSGTTQKPNGVPSPMFVVSAVDVMVKATSENGIASRLPVPVPDNV